jgi:hypothetical protein
MKKTIKFFVLLALVLIPTWVLLDDLILKKLIVMSLEKATKKVVHLEKLNIKYYPNLKIKLTHLKVPNPYQDNFLIIAEDLFIDIETNALLEKSLIINSITSTKATLMDGRERPVTRIGDHSRENSKKMNATSVLKNYLKTSLDFYNDTDVSSTLETTLDFSTEINELETTIDNSLALLDEKKDKVLIQTTNALYQTNSINIDTIKNIDQLNETQKTIRSITQEYNAISKDIGNFENIYNQSNKKIEEINQHLNDKIDSAVSFDDAIKNEIPSTNTVTEPVQTIIRHALMKFRESNAKKTDPKFEGITYNFKKNKSPQFLIKKIEINANDDDHYFRGLNLTTSKHIKNDLNLYLKLFNQNKFDKLIMTLSSSNNRDYELSVMVRNMHLNKTKLYETEDIVVNFLDNNTTDLDITGTLSTSSNITTSAIIKKPNYRVVSKKTTPHFLTSFIPYLNNEDILFDMRLTGELDNISVHVSTNLDPLIKNIQQQVINKKIADIKKRRQHEINRIKEEEFGEINKKSAEFSKVFKKIFEQLKFQEKELYNQLKFKENDVINQKELIERRINQEKIQIKNSVMGKLKKTINQ